VSESEITDIQDLYTKLELDFTSLKDDFMNLEKAYYNLTPIYERIEDKFDMVLNDLKSRPSSGINRRIASLKEVLLDLKSKRGYDIKIFQHIFLLLEKLMKNAAIEIVPPKFLESLTKRVQQETLKVKNIESQRKEKIKKNSIAFMMLLNNNMNFLVPAKKKIWQKIIKNKKNLRIQVKNVEIIDTIVFDQLPGKVFYDKENEKKIAVLYKDKNDNLKGLLIDKFEGMIYLNQNLLKKKIQYLKYNNDHYEPYIQLKGKKYYLIEK